MNLCEKYTLDFERSQFMKIRRRDRIKMRKHLKICNKCRHYIKDSALLDKLLLMQTKSRWGKFVFTDSEKKSMKDRLSR